MCHYYEKDTLQVAVIVVVLLEQIVVRMECICCYHRNIHRASRVGNVKEDIDDDKNNDDDDDDDDEC